MQSEPTNTSQTEASQTNSKTTTTNHQYGLDHHIDDSSGARPVVPAATVDDLSTISASEQQSGQVPAPVQGLKDSLNEDAEHREHITSSATNTAAIERQSRLADTAVSVARRTSDNPIKITSLPNEVLTHVFSHLPPQSLTSIALVSHHFHSLITSPHAWRIAFARYFPGTARNYRISSKVEGDEAFAEKRFFNRLSVLASWRSEYILRTRLLRALSRGRPGEAILSKPRSSNLTVSQVNYFSSINLSITHIDALLSNSPNKLPPKLIHGAEQVGLVTSSEPGAAKADGWGFRDPFSLNEFVDLYPGEEQYGLGRGQVVGLPNSLSVSRRYGMICGEGVPGGRLFFRSIEEQRGRLLMSSRPNSVPDLGIPYMDISTEAICSVWISKTSNVPDMTNGLVGMLSGSSLGVLTAYTVGTDNLVGRRLDRGEMTARWILSPGVPIIALAVDEQFSTKRYRNSRIWAVVLNALGEVFYTTDLPSHFNDKEKVAFTEDTMYENAWRTGRTMSWLLVESTRRIARIDPYSDSNLNGSYSPRGSSNSVGLSKEQIFAETKEIETFIRQSPSHYRSICEGWDMRRRLEVDFAGCNENKAGESIIVLDCGMEEHSKSRINRYTRFKQRDSITPQAVDVDQLDPDSASVQPGIEAIAKTPQWSFEAIHSRRNSMASSTSSSSDGLFETWRVSSMSFGGLKAPQITTTAIDASKFALLTLSEDPLLNLSASTDTSPSLSPLGAVPSPMRPSEVPGQRSRFVAAGTKMGTVFIWNARAPTSDSSEIVNSVEPIRVIYTDSPQISCLALTSLYLVHGGNDGLVQAWDPLASNAQPIRTINSRFSSRARRRIAQAEASPWGVGVNLFAAGALWLDPEPTFLRGMVSLGGHLRYWSYSSQSADQYKSSKRRLRKSERGSNSGGERFSHTGRGAVHDYIANERFELEKEKLDRFKEETRLSGRFGVDLLGPGASEDEIMAYATMLSEEAAKRDEARRGSAIDTAQFGGSAEIKDSNGDSETVLNDADLAAAIQASLDAEEMSPSTHAREASQGFTVRYGKNRKSQSTFVAGSSTDPDADDLNFAMQLSIAEEQSRKEIDEAEYPALGWAGGSSERKDKQRRRS